MHSYSILLMIEIRNIKNKIVFIRIFDMFINFISISWNFKSLLKCFKLFNIRALGQSDFNFGI
jgi:hypothetical protein